MSQSPESEIYNILEKTRTPELDWKFQHGGYEGCPEEVKNTVEFVCVQQKVTSKSMHWLDVFKDLYHYKTTVINQ